ncbi:hypothetical protein, partial [Ralstonia mannitolilytica]|uniref:hypothetical protein n=1 Tax=Ralstonia mannitolilytica TaxID=105219 RepID=UPI003B8438F3
CLGLLNEMWVCGCAGCFTHNLHYVKSYADFESAYKSRCVQSRHAKNRHPRDRQHISKSNTSLFETPASSRRFFFLAILR